jgi:hypothetical protein
LPCCYARQQRTDDFNANKISQADEARRSRRADDACEFCGGPVQESYKAQHLSNPRFSNNKDDGSFLYDVYARPQRRSGGESQPFSASAFLKQYGSSRLKSFSLLNSTTGRLSVMKLKEHFKLDDNVVIKGSSKNNFVLTGLGDIDDSSVDEEEEVEDNVMPAAAGCKICSDPICNGTCEAAMKKSASCVDGCCCFLCSPVQCSLGCCCPSCCPAVIVPMDAKACARLHKKEGKREKRKHSKVSETRHHRHAEKSKSGVSKESKEKKHGNKEHKEHRHHRERKEKDNTR